MSTFFFGDNPDKKILASLVAIAIFWLAFQAPLKEFIDEVRSVWADPTLSFEVKFIPTFVSFSTMIVFLIYSIFRLKSGQVKDELVTIRTIVLDKNIKRKGRGSVSFFYEKQFSGFYYFFTVSEISYPIQVTREMYASIDPEDEIEMTYNLGSGEVSTLRLVHKKRKFEGNVYTRLEQEELAYSSKHNKMTLIMIIFLFVVFISPYVGMFLKYFVGNFLNSF